MPSDDVMERARKIRNRLDGINNIRGDEQRAEYLSVIAQALTEHHDAGMEEAAGIADAEMEEWTKAAKDTTIYEYARLAADRASGARGVRDAIRRAKSTEKA